VGGIRQAFVVCGVLYFVGAALVWLFVKEAYPVSPAAPARRRGGSLTANLRAVLGDRQVVLTLCLLFGLFLGTGYVRPVMPISIEDFSSVSAGREVVRFSLLGRTFELSQEAATGLVFGIVGATSTLAAVAVAPFGERLGYRNCVVGAALVAGLLYLPVAFAHSFTAFLVSLAAVGLFQGAMVPAANALVAVAAPDNLHGSAFGIAASVQSLATFVAPLGGGLTAGLWGVQSVYVTIAVILVLAGIAGLLIIREPAPLAAEGRPLSAPS
jgi:MFS family permease